VHLPLSFKEDVVAYACCVGPMDEVGRGGAGGMVKEGAAPAEW